MYFLIQQCGLSIDNPRDSMRKGTREFADIPIGQHVRVMTLDRV